MPNAGSRRSYRGKHRLAQSSGNGRPRLFATLLAGALLTPAGLSLTVGTAATAQAASFNFRVPTQGYDKDGRAIIHYNNTIHDPAIETAVKHLNATPGLNFVLQPGTGKNAINISNEHFQGDIAGLGGWDNGPFVKLDPKNANFDPDDRTEIAAHELLHAIGLDHNDSGCSIMARTVNRCGDGPSPLGKNEVNELNQMYKRGKPSANSPSDSTPQKGDPGESGDPGDFGDRPTRPNAPGPKPQQQSGDDQQSTPGDWSDWFGDDQGGDQPGGDESFGDPFDMFGDPSDMFGDPSGGDQTFGDDYGDPFSNPDSNSFGVDDFDDGFDWQGGDDASPFGDGDLFGGDYGDPYDIDTNFDWFGDTGANQTFDIADMFGGDNGNTFDWYGGDGGGFDWFGNSNQNDYFGNLAGLF